MKSQIPLWLAVIATIICIIWFVLDLRGQDQLNARLTSDATLVRGGLPVAPTPLFAPPATFIYTEFRSNVVPLVVEITVTSNIIRREVFWMAGRPVTNDSLMTNWVVSRTTNIVQ